jgi:FkbM family methyltransferase
MSKEAFRAEVEGLYERFTARALKADDIVTSLEYTSDTPTDYISGHLQNGVITEEDAVVFSRFQPEMGLILDIGAHWGYMANSIRLSGTKCQIMSFEAMEAHRKSLQILKDSDKIGYDFRIAAISDKENEFTLYGPVINGIALYGLNSVEGRIFTESPVEGRKFADWYADYLVSLVGGQIPEAENYKFQLLATKMRSQPLDVLLGEGDFSVDVRKIAAMKVDVEGHESYVLQGAEKIIKRDHPFIMLEGANRNKEVVTFLGGLGYAFANRLGDQVTENDDHSLEVNGYWVHSTHTRLYRQIGLLAD